MYVKTYNGVKESGFSDVGKTDDSSFQAHAYFGRKTSFLLECQNSDELGITGEEKLVMGSEMKRL